MLRSVLRYPGGKNQLANWTIAHFPRHRCYTEPFGGAASVLMNKPRAYSEVYNDTWGLVVNVFRVLRDKDKAARLKEFIKLLPFAREEFLMYSTDTLHEIEDEVEQAARMILLSYAGYGSALNEKTSTGFRADSKRKGSIPAHDYARYADRIDDFTNRLAGVIIENKDYWEVICSHDSVNTLHYLDPPYVHATRNTNRSGWRYHHELTDSAQELLVTRLLSVKGHVVLAGYDNELYNDILTGWRKFNHVAYATSGKKKTECLWISPSSVIQDSLFNQTT